MKQAVASRRGFLKVTGAAMLGLAADGQANQASADRGEGPSAHGAFDVRDFGAKGDGKNFDTPAINKAIEAAARAGGGTVYFRAGAYLCHSIHLKNRVRLQLASGSPIVAADPPEKSLFGRPRHPSGPGAT